MKKIVGNVARALVLSTLALIAVFNSSTQDMHEARESIQLVSHVVTEPELR
jgi:hypothetical protein